MRCGVGPARGDVDRDVAEEPYAALGGVSAERAPLAVEPDLVGEARPGLRTPPSRRPSSAPGATKSSSSAAVTRARGFSRYPPWAANADDDEYGEPAQSGGPSGSSAHQDWPASTSQSTNRNASRPSFPPGREDTCSRTPLDLRLCIRFQARPSLKADRTRCPFPRTKPPRIQIEDVWPQIDCGRYPVKRSVGDEVEVWATIFRDGHELLGAAIRYRAPGSSQWEEIEMRKVEEQPDRLTGSFHVDRCGRWEFTIEAWVDRFESWRDELRRKVEAGQTDLESELQEGAALLKVLELDVATALATTESDRSEPTRLVRSLEVDADRALARFGAWYELFPRSWGGFKGVEKVLPELAGLGFDVVYFPPIHPIGKTNRKGRNNALEAIEGRPGQPMGDRRKGGRPHRRRSRAGVDRRFRPPGRPRAQARARDRARLRDPVLPRPPLARSSTRSGSIAARTGR